MPSRVLVKHKDLTLEVFEKPELIPSERKNKNGKNIEKLAFKRTNIKLRPRVVNSKPSSNLFGVYCSKRKRL